MTSQRGMMDTEHGKMCGCYKCSKCISWSAILVGAFIGLGLSFLLNLFSVAIGLVAYKNTQDGATAFAIGGYIGLLIGAFVSYFAAGWAAGHLGFPHCEKDRGMFYGFTTWVVSGAIAMLLASSMGHYTTYRTNLLSNPNASYVTATADNPGTSADTTVGAPKQEAANTMMTAAFASFFLFLVAALSSVLGAHCAYRCRYHHDHV